MTPRRLLLAALAELCWRLHVLFRGPARLFGRWSVALTERALPPSRAPRAPHRSGEKTMRGG